MAERDDASAPAGREDASAPAPLTDKLQRFISQHVALVLPFLGLGIFAIRCIMVSRGDPTTATMLIVETSIEDAIRAVVIAVLPILLSLLIIIISWIAGENMLAKGLFDPVTIALFVSVVVLVFATLYAGGQFSAAVATDFPPPVYVVIFLYLAFQTAGYANLRLQGAIPASRLRALSVSAVSIAVILLSLPCFILACGFLLNSSPSGAGHPSPATF
jgi:hypothetical protein